jgi:hypothetical protein
LLKSVCVEILARFFAWAEKYGPPSVDAAVGVQALESVLLKVMM